MNNVITLKLDGTSEKSSANDTLKDIAAAAQIQWYFSDRQKESLPKESPLIIEASGRCTKQMVKSS